MAFSQDHKVRKHSKFSASGASRWFNCSGSIALSEGLPDKDSIYSIEGTRAHEVLELILRGELGEDVEDPYLYVARNDLPKEMIKHGRSAANLILKLYEDAKASEIMVETRVTLDQIHPEAFGSLDAAVAEHFGTLNILDYKYGMALVSPRENLQFIFYALAVAYKFNWNFKKVRMWTLQPRVKGFDGFVFWEITIRELHKYIAIFKDAIDRVEKFPHKYTEGDHCHWCKAKGVCPLKTDKKLEKGKALFTPVKQPKGETDAKKSISSGKTPSKIEVQEIRQKRYPQTSEAQWREESKARKSKAQKSQKEVWREKEKERPERIWIDEIYPRYRQEDDTRKLTGRRRT